MKIRRFILAVILALLVGGVGITKARAYILATYGAPCGEAKGFSGVLQKVHLLAQGDCNVTSRGLCVTFGECHINAASGSTTGTCKMPPGAACTCVPN